MDRADAKKIALLLATAYPSSREVKIPTTTSMWCLLLEDQDYNAVRKAAVAWIKKNTFYPRAAELLAGVEAERTQEDVDDYTQRMRRLLEKLSAGDTADNNEGRK